MTPWCISWRSSLKPNSSWLKDLGQGGAEGRVRRGGKVRSEQDGGRSDTKAGDGYAAEMQADGQAGQQERSIVTV